MDHRIKNRIILVLSFSFIGFLIWSSVQFQSFFSKILPYFENLAHRDNFLSIVVFIGLGTLSTLLSSFSSVPLVPIAIIVWGNIPTALYLFSGWILGDMLSYFVGFYAGNPLARRLLPMEKVESYRNKIPPDAEFKLVFLFIMSMPSEIPNYVLGTLRYNFWKYLVVMFFGELIFAFLTAYAGQALVEKKPILFFGSILLLVALFSYAFYLFQRYLRKKK